MRHFTTEVGPNRARLTAFLHEPASELTTGIPAVVVFPGGGYMTCSEGEADPVALAYFAEGFHAFVLRYSVGAASAVPTRCCSDTPSLRIRLSVRWLRILWC